MKIHKITKKTKLCALALSVYFALMFTNTPNVISEEYPTNHTRNIIAETRSLRDEQVFGDGEKMKNVSSAQEAETESHEDDEKPANAAKDEVTKPEKPQKPAENPPAQTPEATPPEDEPSDETQTKPTGKPMDVIATAYCGCYECNGKWTGYPAADGSPLRPYHTIAADESIPFGTKVYIPYFDTVFEVEDRGSAIVGNRIDIYFDSHSEALEFGMREMTIYIIT